MRVSSAALFVAGLAIAASGGQAAIHRATPATSSTESTASSSGPVNGTELTAWTVGPLEPVDSCACPGVRATESNPVGDTSCVCFNEAQYKVTLPNTLLGSLLPYVPFDPMYDRNLNRLSPTPFAFRQWWFNTTFDGCNGHATLQLRGVNYRADVYVNGALVANSDQIVGTFRRFTIDITGLAPEGQTNHLALLLTPPNDNTFPPNGNSTDLAISFVDWSPDPPDRSMGLIEPTTVFCTAVPVMVTSQSVNTTLDASLDSFNASVSFLVNGLQSLPANAAGGLSAVVELASGVALTLDRVPLPGAVAAAGSARVFFNASAQPALQGLNRRELWNPWQLGDPTMHNVVVRYHSGSSDASGDDEGVVVYQAPIAFREVRSFLLKQNARQFVINGKPVLIRGGGWGPDLFLRMNDTRARLELEMVRFMNLNAIRLEGKFMWDGFFDLADQLGLMILPGWCCCDSWQHWGYWKPEEYTVAAGSLRSQLNRLSRHPSVITFLYSSDQLPPERVEHMYLNVIHDVAWPNPTVSSASASPSNITGPSGVKMSGPYAWVPPAYWLLDSTESFANLGGAWGFLTEGGPGAAPMTLTSWKKTVPAASLWDPAEGIMSSAFGYHCGNPMGRFYNLRYFAPAFYARYGNATSAAATLYLAQASSYEAIRAMFEGYTRNMHTTATGVIQWMMNNPWPSHIWHLFDYYLGAGGGFYGARRACATLTMSLSYADWTVALANAWLGTDVHFPADAPFRASATVYTLAGNQVWTANVTLTSSIAANSVTALPQLTVPYATLGLGATEVVLVRLEWTGMDEASGAIRREFNDYWISGTMDVLNWTDSNYFRTGVSQFANFQQLSTAPPDPEVGSERWNGNQFAVNITNLGGVVLLLVRVVVRSRSIAPIELTPVVLSDSYFNLLPSETREVRGTLLGRDAPPSDVELDIESLNDATASAQPPRH